MATNLVPISKLIHSAYFNAISPLLFFEKNQISHNSFSLLYNFTSCYSTCVQQHTLCFTVLLQSMCCKATFIQLTGLKNYYFFMYGSVCSLCVSVCHTPSCEDTQVFLGLLVTVNWLLVFCVCVFASALWLTVVLAPPLAQRQLGLVPAPYSP